MKFAAFGRLFILTGAAALLFGGAVSRPHAQDAPTASPAVGALPGDTLELLKRVPDNAVLVVLGDASDDNPSIQLLHGNKGISPEDQQALEAMNADYHEAISRILRLFGLNVKPGEKITDALGPRFLAIALPGPKKDGPPSLLFYAGVKDRAQAESRIGKAIGSIARNAVETTNPASGGTLHTWTGLFMGKGKVSYLIGDAIAAISTEPTLLNSATPSDHVPAWLVPLTEAVPRGLMNLYVSPGLTTLLPSPPKEMGLNPEDLGFAGQASALTLSDDGLTYTQTALLSKEGMLPSVLAAAAQVPSLTDASFRHLPEGTLAAVGVSSPAAWLKALGGLPMFAPFLGGESGGDKSSEPGFFMKLLTTTLNGDVAVGMRTLLPLPSPIVTVSSADEAGATEKYDALVDLANKMKMPLVTSTVGGSPASALKIGKGPYQNAFLARQGTYLVGAADLRTLEEASATATGGSLADDPAFQAVWGQVGADSKLFAYADLSAMSGGGMILANAYFPGNPIGRYLSSGFKAVHGAGMGLQIAPDRITSRAFLSGNPNQLLPVLSGATIAAVPLIAAVGMPNLMQARQKAQESRCSSNMKQLALGMVMYAQDHDERFPKANAWQAQITPYVKDQGIFHCPVDGKPGTSYAMNQKLSGMSMARVTDPAHTILFYESSTSGSSPNGIGADLDARHNGEFVVAYVDGHVETRSGSLDISEFRLDNAVHTAPVMAPPTHPRAPQAKPRKQPARTRPTKTRHR